MAKSLIDLDVSGKNTLTGVPSRDWTRQSANAREKVNQGYIATLHLRTAQDVKKAIREKYERAGQIDRGPAFRRMRASCGGQLNLSGFRRFLDISGIYVSNPAGRDIVKEVFNSKKNQRGIIDFPTFAELCFGNESLVSDIRKHGGEQSMLALAKSRQQTQDSQADIMYSQIKGNPFLILRDKLNKRGKRSFSEKFALLQLLASYRDSSLRRDGFSIALQKIGMKMTPQEVGDMFKTCDLNGDGEIDYQEFCATIMGSPAYVSPKGQKQSRQQVKMTARSKAFASAARVQRIAEEGYHLLKTVSSLKDVVQQTFDKLNTGISASASFMRLKKIAGARVNAIQFAGLMKFIKLNKIAAKPDLVHKFFDKMVAHSKGIPNKKKTAFTLADFTKEFFPQEATSKSQEEDSAFLAHQEMVKSRERAQNIARQDMANRKGIFFDTKTEHIAGGSRSDSLLRQAGMDLISTRSQQTKRSRRHTSRSHSTSRTYSSDHDSLKTKEFSALPKGTDSRALKSAMAKQPSKLIGQVTARSNHNLRTVRNKEIPIDGIKHTRVTQRARQSHLKILLKKQGMNMSREEISRLASPLQ